MNKNKQKGYSLVEMLIYLAIFTIMSIAVINSFIVIMSSFTTTRTNRDLLESGSTAMERMSREIRQAISVDVANSTLGTNSGLLQLNSTNNSGNVTVVKFNVLNGNLNLSQDGVLFDNLLGQNISTTNLIFRRIATTKGEAIKIELTLQDTKSKNLKTANFYNTIILRGGY